MKLIEELKRRNVFRVGAAYVLLGWVVIQVTDTVTPALNLPDWTLGLVTWLGIIGFPFALFFAWAFELTPDGLRRETDAPDSDVNKAATAQKLDITLVVLLVVTIGVIAWSSIGDDADIASPGDESSLAATESMSIAVLPLTNMSADSNNAYFAGGVHEEILTNLSRIDGLRVVSRTTALRYIDSDLSLRDIGLDLGVRYIVEGSVRRVENHVRITVQLIDAPSDAHVWASNYDRELVDVFALQSEVAKAITNSLHLEIQPETVGTLDDMPTTSVKAYDLYTKALSISRSEPESEEALLQQRELLEEAVSIDPDFVAAWALLNEILDFISRHILQNDWFGETEEEREVYFEETQLAAHRALEKAVALGPDNVMTLLAQASDYVHEQQSRDFQTSRKEYIDRALEIEPNNAFAQLVLAWWYRIEGNMESATPAFNRALELDPLNARIVDSSLIHFRLIGDQEKTTELYERLTQIAPEKKDDTRLGKVHPTAKLDNLSALFIQTADESIIDTYALALEQVEETGPDALDFDRVISNYQVGFHRSQLDQMRGDLVNVGRQPPSAPPDDTNADRLFFYLWAEASYLKARALAGATDDVTAAADRMSAAYEELLDSDSAFAGIAYLPMCIAWVATDNEAEIENALENFEGMNDDVLFSRMSGPFIAYSAVDPEGAIKLALQRKAEHPSWFGTDWIATLHVMNRELLLHPDMQAFYVEEDKWIDYLAARVPEYAKYRQ
jgi:TolB-like protein